MGDDTPADTPLRGKIRESERLIELVQLEATTGLTPEQHAELEVLRVSRQMAAAAELTEQMSRTSTSEWVASGTYSRGEMFYEVGGVYGHRPLVSWGTTSRPFVPGEPVALCPRCGQRFAATEGGTAESHRDLHFDGDDVTPSICRNMPTRRFRLVEPRGET